MPSKTRSSKRRVEPLEARPDELGSDPAQVGPDSAGLSGDAQGLSSADGPTSESVEELTAEGQRYEASIVEGLEDAADHPGQPIRLRSERRPPTLLADQEATPDLEIANRETGEDNG